MNMFFTKTKMINIMHISSKHKEEHDEMYETNKSSMHVPRTRVALEDVSIFKNKQLLFPDQILTKFASATLTHTSS